MCCHETYERVLVFQSEKRSRYRLGGLDSLSTPPAASSALRRFASDGGLVTTDISEKVIACWALQDILSL